MNNIDEIIKLIESGGSHLDPDNIMFVTDDDLAHSTSQEYEQPENRNSANV